MSIIDDLMEGNVGTGLLIGIGVAILAPIVLPILACIVKPVAKAAVKGGVMLFEKGKEVVAETGEIIEDVFAEAKAELAEEQTAAAGGVAAVAMGAEQGATTSARDTTQEIKETVVPNEA
jgi:hypothetical protein